MVIKSFKVFFRISVFLLLISTLVFGIVIAWIVKEPRSLSFVSEYILDDLNSINSEYKYNVGKSYIKWNDENKNFNINVKNISVTDDKEKQIALLPNIDIDFNIWSLITGNILSSKVKIDSPTFHIDNSDNNQKQNNEIEIEDIVAFLKNNLPFILDDILDDNFNNYAMKLVNINNLNIYFTNSKKPWQIKSIDIDLKKQQFSKIITSNFDINFNNQKTKFTIIINKLSNDDDKIKIVTNFINLPSTILSNIISKSNMLKQSNLILNGSFNIILSLKKEIPQIRFNITKAIGYIHDDNLFNNQVKITNLKIIGGIYNNLKIFNIDNMELFSDQKYLKITASSEIPQHIFDKNIDKEYFGLNTNIILKNIKTSELKNLWPKILAPKTKKWIDRNINNGYVDSANVKISLLPKDVEKISKKSTYYKEQNMVEYNKLGSLPDNAIMANINAKNLDITYSNVYPIAKNINANIKFDANKMYAKILNSNLEDIFVKSSDVTISNLWQYPANLNVKANIASNANSLTKIIKDSLNDKNLKIIYKNLPSFDDISADIVTNLKINLPLIENITPDKVDINILAKTINLKIPNFYQNHPVTDGIYIISLKDKNLNIKGNGVFLDNSFYIDMQKPLDKEEMSYNLKSNIKLDILRQLNLIENDNIKGSIHANIESKSYRHHKVFSGILDITNSEFTLADYGFEKKIYQPSNVKFNVELLKNNHIKINEFNIDGSNIQIKGNGLLDGNKQFKEISLKTAKYGFNNYQLQYESFNNARKLYIKGSLFDYNSLNLRNILKLNNQNNEIFLDIDLDIDNLRTKYDVMLKDVIVNINCSNKYCSNLKFDAKTLDGKYITSIYEPLEDSSNSFIIKSDDAGTTLKALGLTDDINDGELVLESKINRFDNDLPNIEGNLKIYNFTAKKTNILSRLLTLASLKGVTDLLQERGISFKKFNAPFKLDHQVLTIKDANTSGSSVGVTADGIIDINKKLVDLKGIIVPASEINNLISNIPIVGTIITGEGKGKGALIATNYSIKGNFDNVELSVNPLSILAPGFLRKIFQ